MGDACLNRRQSPVQSPDGVKYPSVWLAGGQEPLRVIRMACALQQLATPNHNTHTHTQSVTVCDYIPATPAVVPRRLHPDYTTP